MKKLIEKKEALIAKAEEMLNVAAEEVRGFSESEDSQYNEIKMEIEGLNKTIVELEKRNREGAAVVVENKDEERGEDIMDKDLELRGMEQFIRGIDGEEVRAMTTENGAGIIPSNLDTNIIKALYEVAPLFAEVPMFTPMAGTLSIPIEDEIGSAGFVGEGIETESSDFKLKTIELTQKRAGSELTLNQFLINDSGIDIVSYAQSLLFERLGLALNRAMITGLESNKSIEGLVNAPASCNYSGEFGVETFIGALASMKFAYQGGAKWVMNRNRFEAVAKLKDATGNLYVAREIINDTVQYKLFGSIIDINDAVADDKVYLVNIKQAYRGMIKKGASLSKISEDTVNRRKGTVTLVLDTYVDAKIAKPEAIKVITFAGAESKKVK